MLKNYIIIAVRNLLKNRIFSVINILGLALGLCCVLLIALWVNDEFRIDQFHSKKDRIYTVVSEINASGSPQFWANTPGLLAGAINEKVTGVEGAIKSTYSESRLIFNGDKSFKETGLYVDSAFLMVFDFPLISGNREDALSGLNNIVISKKMALKIFKQTDVVGKILKVRDGKDEEFLISGVMDDIPAESYESFDFLIPYAQYQLSRGWNKQWGNYNDITYVLLSENSKKSEVESQISNIIKEQDDESETVLHLLPTCDFYLKVDLTKGIDENGRIIYVKIFSVVGIIILLIACINFMNLSTARAGKRAKEVGVRKASGAQREMLVFQFLGESIFIALISMVLAVTIADVLMPFYNSLTLKSLFIPYRDPIFILIALSITLLTGLLAGIYPALHLSKYQPARVLKGAMFNVGSLSGFRRVLVISQFSLSILFITATIIANSQLSHVLNKDLGLEKDNIIYFPIRQAGQNYEAFKNELEQLPEVKSVTYSNFNPLQIGNTTYSPTWKGKLEDDKSFFHVIQADHSFTKTFSIEILQGKGFPEQVDTANAHFLINQQAAIIMGMSEPVGQEITVWGSKGTIYGLIKDFHHQSLFQKIEPVIVFQQPMAWEAFVLFDEQHKDRIIGSVQGIFEKYESDYPFEYEFVEQDYEKQYTSVAIVGKLTAVFSGIAIIVSCLGLFGLASFLTEQRRKETGVRKTFGASIWQLTAMFSWQFVKLVVVSFIISAPITYYFVENWLERFSYRIEMTIFPFIISGLLALFIALITVSYHTIKASMLNPIHSLRYE